MPERGAGGRPARPTHALATPTRTRAAGSPSASPSRHSRCEHSRQSLLEVSHVINEQPFQNLELKEKGFIPKLLSSQASTRKGTAGTSQILHAVVLLDAVFG